jgi:hypothetical protein
MLRTSISGCQQQRTRADLVLRFGANDLFIQYALTDFESLEQAQRFIADGPSVAINNGVYLRCPDGRLRELYGEEDTADECGRWIEGANRDSLDDWLSSLLNVEEFLRWNPQAHSFKLYWFGIAEWSLHGNGHPSQLVRSTSGRKLWSAHS